MKYGPSLESIQQHHAPDWYHDAKLGIMITWGLYSIPAFASSQVGPFPRSIVEHGFKKHFLHNPYAEWYLNTMRLKDSPTAEHHRKTYGPDFKYDDFIPRFNKAAREWDPEEWGDLFRRIQARYAVLVSRHCDGFALWPSRHPHPLKGRYHAERNIVAELSAAVRKRGLKMGLYYCTGMEWNFVTEPIHDFISSFCNCPVDPRYLEFCRNQLLELIHDFTPSVLWADVGYPPKGNVAEILAAYYNAVPEGVVNDRFFQASLQARRLLQFAPLGSVSRRINGAIADAIARRVMAKMVNVNLNPLHKDFITPEYSSFPEIQAQKWEACRGIGHSFGHNQSAPDSDCLSVDQLIRLLVDIVSKNGNLLLNVGPAANGQITEIEKDRLIGLGRWLEVNGPAIFNTRPWRRAEGKTGEGIDVRFTRNGKDVYALLLATPQTEMVSIKSFGPDPVMRVTLLGSDLPLRHEIRGADLWLPFPGGLQQSAVWTYRIEMAD